MLKRRMLALMLSVVCCGGAILAGCSQNQGAGTSDAVTSAGGKTGNDVQEGTGADSGGDTAGKNKLAYFFPLTGDNMQYGEMLMRGSELAVELFNKENGTDYITEFNDDKGDATEAVNVANKIVSDSSVIAGLGSYASSCAMAAAPIFESNKLLLVSPAASHTDFPGMGEFMFSCVMNLLRNYIRLQAVRSWLSSIRIRTREFWQQIYLQMSGKTWEERWLLKRPLLQALPRTSHLYYQM